MKIKVHKIEWTVWQLCDESLTPDFEIEVPDYFAALVSSVETSYSDLVRALEDFVQDQHGQDRVV